MISVRLALGALALGGGIIALIVLGPRTPRLTAARGGARDGASNGRDPDQGGHADGTSMGDVPYLPPASRLRSRP
jgi:hypothetical protein